MSIQFYVSRVQLIKKNAFTELHHRFHTTLDVDTHDHKHYHMYMSTDFNEI